MTEHPELSSKIAEYLLEIKAVILRPEAPFTWASGWKSPVYCDNRLTLSYPEIRREITRGLVLLARELFPDTQAVAGVATAGIPQGAWVAEALNLPYLYVRSEPKSHGMGNQIEGILDPEKPVLLIEDLISTGGSSLKAVEAIRKAGGKVSGLLAVFQYGFPQAEELFQKNKVSFATLTDARILVPKAVEKDYICEADAGQVQSFLADPAHWLNIKN